MSGTVVLDLDGTLVDSVPVHVLAWQAAFRDVGVSAPSHRLHRAIGMGGDRLVAQVAGDAVEHAVGEELRRRHPERLDDLFDRIVPTEGAVELLETLRDRDVTTVLASSSDADLTDRLLELLGPAAGLLQRVVSGSAADSSKPSGELIAVAIEQAVRERHGSSGSAGAGGAGEVGDVVVVGDAVWDVAAAQDAGVPCVAVLTGGVSAAELREAGAVGVHETAGALAGLLGSGSTGVLGSWRTGPSPGA